MSDTAGVGDIDAAGFEQLPGSCIVALIECDISQIVQRASDASPTSEFAPDRQALLVQEPGSTNIALSAGHCPQIA